MSNNQLTVNLSQVTVFSGNCFLDGTLTSRGESTASALFRRKL
jgi:hypothetical protein